MCEANQSASFVLNPALSSGAPAVARFRKRFNGALKASRSRGLTGTVLEPSWRWAPVRVYGENLLQEGWPQRHQPREFRAPLRCRQPPHEVQPRIGRVSGGVGSVAQGEGNPVQGPRVGQFQGRPW